MSFEDYGLASYRDDPDPFDLEADTRDDTERFWLADAIAAHNEPGACPECNPPT